MDDSFVLRDVGSRLSNHRRASGTNPASCRWTFLLL